LKHYKFLSFFLFKGTGAFLTFFLIFISTKILTPYEYGIFALLLTLINLCSAVLAFGIPSYFFEIVSSKKKFRRINDTLKSICIIISFISLIFFILTALTSSLISSIIFKELNLSYVIFLLGILIVFGILNEIFSNYYIASRKYYISTIGNNYLLPLLILVYFFLSFTFKFHNLKNLLIFTLATLPVITFFYTFYINLSFKFLFFKTSMKKINEIIKPCLNLSLITISGIILLSSDIIILGILSNPSSVSNYYIASKIASVLSLILASSMSFYYGKSLESLKNNKIYNIKRIVLRSNFISMLLGLFLIILIFVFQKFLFQFIFFDIEQGILTVLIFILCFGQFVNIIFGFQGSLLVILQKYRKIISLIFIFTVLTNISLSIIGYYLLGTIGIAYATMVSIILRELLISYFFLKKYKFYPLAYFLKMFDLNFFKKNF
jgi:O-antigen/teichoic acid export membrane protein